MHAHEAIMAMPDGESNMQQTDPTITTVLIRISAIVIVLSLYQYWPLTTLAVGMLEQVVYNYRY